MKNVTSAKYLLMVCTSTSSVEQHAKLLKKVFCYCFKEVEKTFVNIVVKHVIGHLK